MLSCPQPGLCLQLAVSQTHKKAHVAEEVSGSAHSPTRASEMGFCHHPPLSQLIHLAIGAGSSAPLLHRVLRRGRSSGSWCRNKGFCSCTRKEGWHTEIKDHVAIATTAGLPLFSACPPSPAPRSRRSSPLPDPRSMMLLPFFSCLPMEERV